MLLDGPSNPVVLGCEATLLTGAPSAMRLTKELEIPQNLNKQSYVHH